MIKFVRWEAFFIKNTNGRQRNLLSECSLWGFLSVTWNVHVFFRTFFGKNRATDLSKNDIVVLVCYVIFWSAKIK